MLKSSRHIYTQTTSKFGFWQRESARDWTIVSDPIFKKDLILSDGTEWQISDHLEDFCEGIDVYVGQKKRGNMDLDRTERMIFS